MGNHRREQIFRQRDYLIAFIKAFDAVEHLLHPEMLWHFLENGRLLETLREGLLALYPDSQEYENAILPVVADGLWTAAISNQSSPSTLCLQLCMARTYFPNVPDWIPRVLNEVFGTFPVVPAIKTSAVKAIIEKVLTL
jgi:hypothetical protein